MEAVKTDETLNAKLQKVSGRVQMYLVRAKVVKDPNVLSAYFDYLFKTDEEKVLAAAEIKARAKGDKDAKKAYKNFKKLPVFAQIADLAKDLAELYKRAFALMIENIKASSKPRVERLTTNGFAQYKDSEKPKRSIFNKSKRKSHGKKYAEERKVEDKAREARKQNTGANISEQKLKNYNENVKARGMQKSAKEASQPSMGSQMSR